MINEIVFVRLTGNTEVENPRYNRTSLHLNEATTHDNRPTQSL